MLKRLITSFIEFTGIKNFENNRTLILIRTVPFLFQDISIIYNLFQVYSVFKEIFQAENHKYALRDIGTFSYLLL